MLFSVITPLVAVVYAFQLLIHVGSSSFIILVRRYGRCFLLNAHEEGNCCCNCNYN